MSTAFQPIGDVSRRRMIIDHFGSLPEGTVVSYTELENLLDSGERRTLSSAVNAAKPGLEREHLKAVEPIRNIGYRIVHATEHLELARQHQVKSRRQLVRSQSKVLHVDISGLTEGERLAVTLAATSLGHQLEYMRRNDIRSARIEEAVSNVQSSQERSLDEIEDLKQRLAALEDQTRQQDSDD